MAVKTIDADLLAKMFLAGARNLEAKKEMINELNVFPVPDGDTGTNMSMTMMSAAQEVAALKNPDMPSLAKAVSSGSLRGARGNSGVILSQLLRGFAKVVKDKETIDVKILAKACERARDTAYKAVMKPKEGTILTVARAIAEKAAQEAENTEDLEIFIPSVIGHAREALLRTPEMLPVLKEAGVVDSGGQGLLEALCGAYDAFLGKEIDYEFIAAKSQREAFPVVSEVDTEITFGYCTEFIILTEKEFSEKEEEDFKTYLESIGDSIVCVADEGVVKVHVHTDDPGLALQKALTFGQLSRIKVDNMREEHQEKVIRDAQKAAKEQALKREELRKEREKKEMGFLVVSAGRGLKEIFEELGASYIIEGGQTMNPSTEDILNAVNQVNARTVFILPNNKNIILAANQARDLAKDKEIIVIPTQTIPQGITAVISYDSDKDAHTNEQAMLEEIKKVKSGQVTYAVRDTNIEDKKIHKGDIMGIADEGILSVGKELAATTKELLSRLVDGDSELISLYYGEEVKETEALRLAKEIEKLYPNIDVDVHFGGQPVYYYMLAVE